MKETILGKVLIAALALGVSGCAAEMGGADVADSELLAGPVGVDDPAGALERELASVPETARIEISAGRRALLESLRNQPLLATQDGPAITPIAGDVDVPPVIPAMEWLAGLPREEQGERALAEMFAQGTATHVPVGVGTGFPALFNSVTELNGLAAGLWGGKTFRVVSDETHPNGDPIVRLDNKIVKLGDGALIDLFDAYVTRSTIPDLDIGTNGRGEKVFPPSGALDTVHLSFLDEPVIIDDKPSIVLNYFEDRSLPVIRRILDEIREVDAENCPGLYLGRAHVRRCTSLYCGELPSPLVDFPEKVTLESRYEWAFWTYFILNFGQPTGQCDLAPLASSIEDTLTSYGLPANLPAPPAAD